MYKKVCIIIDGFSSGKHFAPELTKRGYSCIHLVTNKNLYASFLDKNESQYLETLFIESCFDEVLEKLRKYDIVCTLPGIEGNSVIVADQLNEALRLPGNISYLSESRRNKYMMHKILKKNKLQSITSIQIYSRDKLITKHPKIKHFPKVIKPEAAGGSQDVHICHSEKELIDVFESAVGRMNECGVKNHSMIIQPYIEGEEYFINTTSCQGKHYINDIWVYQKKLGSNNEPICHGSRLLECEGEAQNIIIPYCYKVLDALGILNGPAHIEIILQNNKPYFIELGARLMGGAINNMIFEKSVGYSQLNATIDCYLAPDTFFKKTKKPYRLKKYLEFINVNADTSGILKFLFSRKQLQLLPSYIKDIWLVKDGDYIKKTVDDLTSIGLIILQHENAMTIKKDRQYIQKNLSDIFSIN